MAIKKLMDVRSLRQMSLGAAVLAKELTGPKAAATAGRLTLGYVELAIKLHYEAHDELFESLIKLAPGSTSD